MQKLLEEVCQTIRNWFVNFDNGDVYSGSYEISGGVITGQGTSDTPEITTGMYYRIVGSFKNDGVYLAGTDTPIDEQFNGQIWLMHPTAAFLALVTEIGAWQTLNGGADSTNMSPFNSESFGGYSYSKGGNASGGTAVSWKSQFASRLNAWRKI
jgi:hypothetical protein